MIITKTPFRMSFFGGGTDMEEYDIQIAEDIQEALKRMPDGTRKEMIEMGQ